MTQLSENAQRVLDALGLRTVYMEMVAERAGFEEIIKVLRSPLKEWQRPPFIKLLTAFEKLAEHATRVMSEPGSPTVEQIIGKRQ